MGYACVLVTLALLMLLSLSVVDAARGYGSRGHKGDKGYKGADASCSPDRLYKVRSFSPSSVHEGAICSKVTGSTRQEIERCVVAKCAWPKDVLLTGSCKTFDGVGRAGSPIRRSKEGEDVKPEGLDPVANGWACSIDDLGEANREAEAVAVCCAAALPTTRVIDFDDLATPDDIDIFFGTDDGGLEGSIPMGYRGFIWGAFALTSNTTTRCTNGFANAVVSKPNAVGFNGMVALPGLKFTVASMYVTAATAANATATFIGIDGDFFGHDFNISGTVNATVNITGPTEVDLESLGRMSALLVTTPECTPDGEACVDICSPNGSSLLVVDNISVTVFPEPSTRNTRQPRTITNPLLSDGLPLLTQKLWGSFEA